MLNMLKSNYFFLKSNLQVRFNPSYNPSYSIILDQFVQQFIHFTGYSFFFFFISCNRFGFFSILAASSERKIKSFCCPMSRGILSAVELTCQNSNKTRLGAWLVAPWWRESEIWPERDGWPRKGTRIWRREQRWTLTCSFSFIYFPKIGRDKSEWCW